MISFFVTQATNEGRISGTDENKHKQRDNQSIFLEGRRGGIQFLPITCGKTEGDCHIHDRIN